MTITIDGGALSFELEKERSLGDILFSLDSWLDGQGLIMSRIDVDGNCVSQDIDAVKDRAIDSIGRLDVRTERVSHFKRQTLAQAAAWLAGIGDWASGSASKHPAALLEEGDLLLSSNAGFLDAEEISFLEFARNSLKARASAAPGSERAELSANAARMAGIFAERLSEIEDPRGQALRAAESLRAERESILNIPVFLQTGRENEAMEAISRFTDLFSKTLRLLPSLNESGIDTMALSIDGQSSTDFFTKLNGTLLELMDAFSRKDTVLIGDLSEYEVLPRLESMFAALEKTIKETN